MCESLIPFLLKSLGEKAIGKLGDKLWQAGEGWATRLFGHIAASTAMTNVTRFVDELRRRIAVMREERSISEDEIEAARHSPEFAAVLQKALISAAQTENREKHQILARIVAERLAAEPESVEALASKLALDAIPNMASKHLRILGFSTQVLHLGGGGALSAAEHTEQLQERLAAYASLQFTDLDVLHLESLSCLRLNRAASAPLAAALAATNSGVFDETFLVTPLGQKMQHTWDKHLCAVELTTVGQIIGVYVSDLLTGSTTDLTDWWH